MDNHSSAILNGSKIAQELESPIRDTYQNSTYCRNQVSKSHKDANLLTGNFTDPVNVL